MRLGDLLERATARRPEAPFLVHGEETISYGECHERANGLAERLAELGVLRGDRIAVILPNIPEIVYSWFALARLGAVMIPLNPALVTAEIEPMLRLVQARGILGDAGQVALYGERLGLQLRVVVGAGEAPGGVPFAAPRRVEPPRAGRVSAHDLLTVLQSSGTTGTPKAAGLTHLSYTVPAREFVRWMEVVPQDRFLACLPLFHMAGQAFAASAVAGGASLVLVRHFSARELWGQVRRYGVTVVRHLGEMLAVLCQQPEAPDDREHTLRAVYGGGARSSVVEEFERRFGAAVVEGYGLTETNTVLRNELKARRHGSIGCPPPYCKVRIADGHGRPLPPFQIGEIQVERNAVMMASYLGAPELTAEVFADGWFRTGDLGYQDEEGYFHFAGREKDVIRRRGENVLAPEVERVIHTHPAVALAAVVGVPDPFGGEEVKAHLTCRPGSEVSPEDLVAWCRGALAEFKVPRYFEFHAELPRTATNKINKSKLRALRDPAARCYDRHSGSWEAADVRG